LHQVDACWYTEDGEEIEIEALVPLAGTNVASSVYPLTITAGHGYR